MNIYASSSELSILDLYDDDSGHGDVEWLFTDLYFEDLSCADVFDFEEDDGDVEWSFLDLYFDDLNMKMY